MMTVPGLALFGGTAGLLEGNLYLLLTPALRSCRHYGLVSRGVTYGLLEPVSDFVPLRVSLQQEPEGLDISQRGEALR